MFSTVFNTAEEIPPGCSEDVRVAGVRYDCPVGIGYSDVIHAGVDNIDECLFGDKGCVVFLKYLVRR